MKKNILLTILVLMIVPALQSQTTISLIFSSTINGLHQPLDSIYIENLTQGGDTTLYGTDTVLVLEQGIGIHETTEEGSRELILLQSRPNPFSEITHINIYLPQDEPVLLRVFDLQGKEIAAFRQSLQAGHHSLLFTPGKEHIYLLFIETPSQSKMQKLIHIGSSSSSCNIQYISSQKVSLAAKSTSNQALPWVLGDHLKFIGFTFNGSDTIHANPSQSGMLTFQLHSPPVAGFSVSDSLIHINDTVHFSDLTTNNPNSWKWDFGDGDSSIIQHPSHIYTTSGFYTVKLIVCNAMYCDTLSKVHCITAYHSLPGQPCPGQALVADYNGNLYNTVKIGNQCWLKENLRARNYSNGQPIPLVEIGYHWQLLTSDGRSWYLNDSAAYALTYGALYNWYAVTLGNACPVGWHVPTKAELNTLINYLGGDSIAGGALKEAYTTHWQSPNIGATNITGFTALPGGFRDGFSGLYIYNGAWGHWWTATPDSSENAHSLFMYHNNAKALMSPVSKNYGFSIRCVKN